MEGSYVLIKDAGPREWLGLIANADLVLTDSFHGTVFSILLSSHNFIHILLLPIRGGHVLLTY